METKEIKEIFEKTYNNMPNPVFCYPQFYFQYRNFICEVAAAKKPESVAHQISIYGNPLRIFDLLFCDDGYWITVLQQHGDYYEKREDLNCHIDEKEDFYRFINETLCNQ